MADFESPYPSPAPSPLPWNPPCADSTDLKTLEERWIQILSEMEKKVQELENEKMELEAYIKDIQNM